MSERILLITGPARGHINALVGVAQRLMAAGHEVGWLVIGGATERIRSLGVDVVECDLSPLVPDAKGEVFAKLVETPQALSRWIRALLLDSVSVQVQPLRDAIRRWRAAAIGTDPSLYQAVIASHLENVPYVCISNSLNPVVHPTVDCELARTLRALRALRNSLFAEFGMKPRFRLADVLSPHLTTVFSTVDYLGRHADVPANTELVGPSLPMGHRGDEPTDFPTGVLRGRAPLIYVAFGSQIAWQPDIYDRIVRGAESLGSRVLIAAGELANTRWAKEQPDYVTVVPWAPQRAVLDRASVFVTHAGPNSVMEALCAGTPMMLVPICNDQPINADLVHRAGCGLLVPASEMTHSHTRETLRALLSPAPIMQKALARVRESYRAKDGAKVVASRLAALARG